MTGIALIVDAGTPELTALAVRSLEKYAPAVEPFVMPSVGTHAETIEAFRRAGYWTRFDVVVLLDSDAAILSTEWWKLVTYWFGRGFYEAMGGLRSRGDASQLFIGNTYMLHASCLAMTAGLFSRVSSFADEWDEVTAFHQIDTAGRVSLEAKLHLHYPFRRVGHGPLYPGLQVGEYYDPASDQPLWVHCWRGTSSQTPRWRHELRKIKARLGSPHAVSMLRHEARVAAYIARTKELLA